MDGDKNTKSICVGKMLTLIVGAWCPLCPRSLWCDARFVSSLFCWKICAEIWVGVSLAPLLALTAGRGSLGLALLARKDAQDSLDAGQGQRSSIQVIRAAAFKPGLIYHGRVCFLGPVSKSLEVFPLMLVRLSPEPNVCFLGKRSLELGQTLGLSEHPHPQIPYHTDIVPTPALLPAWLGRSSAGAIPPARRAGGLKRL